MGRGIVYILALALVALLTFLTVRVLLEDGVTILVVVALAILAVLMVGALGALGRGGGERR
jgi:hypothetical protein